MKIAIIGGGIGGLLAADHFDRLGARIVLFAKEPLGGGVERMSHIDPDASMEYPWKCLTPSYHSCEAPDQIPTVEEYQTLFLHPLIKRIQSSGHWKNVFVTRVQKCFLGTEENIPDSSGRLKDLFRAVYRQDELEYYEDFDMIIDASGVFRYPYPMGGGSTWAINEKMLEEKHPIFKSWDIFKHLRPNDSLPTLLVGSGALGAHYCRLFFQQFENQPFILVTDEREPFEKLIREGRHPHLAKEIQRLLSEKYRQWKQQYLAYEKQLASWQSLESFEKAKTPKPVEPTAILHIYAGYNVISVDALADRNGLFVTIERPAFRGEEQPPKTLNVDHIAVATGFCRENKELLQGMRPPFKEPGLYRLGEIGESCHHDIPQILEGIPLIEKNILSFFSRVS